MNRSTEKTREPRKNKGREKVRLDVLLVSLGLAETRERAQRHILAHEVTVDGRTASKAGERVPSDADVRLTAPERYVGRGALKLEAALRGFAVDPTGLVCADIGASTGGFTDCLLQHGARRVFALDVGRTQLHERVRADPRVTVLDHTNARAIHAGTFQEPPDLFVVDVSFISVRVILPAMSDAARPGVRAVVLVKPQFEAGRAEAGRGRGVIRSADTHRRVLAEVVGAASACGWVPAGLMPSPVLGGAGNREFLLLLERAEPGARPAGGFDIDAGIARACMEPTAGA